MAEQDVKIPEHLNVSTEIQFVGTAPQGQFRLGLGVANEAGKQARKLTNEKVLIIADPTVVKLNLDQSVKASLQSVGMRFDIFSEINPEPQMESMEAVCRCVRSEKYGLVIGLGGGSAMDTAKMAAVSACTSLSTREIVADISQVTKKLPLILLPTTAGTGSEMSPYIVLSDHDRKIFVTSSVLYATVAMVDPLLMKTMPPKLTAFTGLDALTHGVEGAIGKTNPYTLAMASKCVELVFKYLPRAVENGGDIEARYYMAFASVLGMLAYTQGGGLFAHSISYLLTTAYQLPHGAGCGLALPYTLRFNQEYIDDVLDEFEKSIGKKNFIEQVDLLIKKIGAPTTLKELGVTEELLPMMAEKLLETYDRPRNPRKLEIEDAVSLMRYMYQGL